MSSKGHAVGTPSESISTGTPVCIVQPRASSRRESSMRTAPVSCLMPWII
jgi:hypothetical protein